MTSRPPRSHPSPTSVRALQAPFSSPGYPGSPGSINDAIGETDDGPEAWALGGGAGVLGGGVGGSGGVLGAGEGGGGVGRSGCDGEGFAVPGPPPEPPWPPAPGSGPDGCTGRVGVPGSDGVAEVPADGASFFPFPPAGCAPPLRPSRCGPTPRPSTVTPPGPGAAPFPSCCAALPGRFGCGASLTLMQPARDAASAETVTATVRTRERTAPGGGCGGAADTGAGGGIGDE